MSTTILTTSELEAILKTYRGSLKTVQKGRIMWGRGGGEVSLVPLHLPRL